MMGEKTFTPKQVYRLDWERRIPPDHLLRRVHEAVDFSFVRRLTARFSSHTGKPSIDPVVLIKMALLGYRYGITSERRLAEDLRLNLAFMWFVGDDRDEPPPDHSVLSTARRRFGVTVYQACFAEIARQCQQAGLVTGDRLFIDSTLVAAHAEDAALRSRVLLEQRGNVEAHLAALWQDNDRLCKEHEGMAGCHLREVVADMTYGTDASYRLLEGRAIRPSIPLLGSAWDRRALPRTLFRYDHGADCSWCPAGQVLKRQGVSRAARVGGGVIDRASPQACGACAQKAACCGTAQARTNCRAIQDDGLLERVRTHLRTPRARRSISQRTCWAETVMAEVQERHGLRRCGLRSRTTVRTQADLAAMAYNLKKLARARRPQPQPLAVALRSGLPTSPPPRGSADPSARQSQCPARSTYHLAKRRPLACATAHAQRVRQQAL